jgi:peptidyl-prolyl cis-trans isomerase SurA
MLSKPRRPSFAAALLVAACAVTLVGCNSSKTSAPVEAAVATPATPPPVTEVAPTLPKSAGSSIPVLVNGVPITSYDIDQRIRLMRLGGAKATKESAQNDLIDETLEGLEAQRAGISVPQAQIDAAFASIGSHLKMTPATLTQALASQGIAADTLKKRLRAQIAWSQLVQMRTQQKAKVSNSDVNALISGKDAKSLTIQEYTLQQIVFVVPQGSSNGAYAQRQAEAAAFRQSFPGCDKSLDKAKNLRGVVVKDIGRRDSTQLSGPQGDAIMKTPVGSAAPPDRTSEGIELIAVCASQAIQSAEGARAEAESSLYAKQAQGLGEDYLKELRKLAIIEYR